MYSLGCKKDPKDLRDIPMSLVLPAIPIPVGIDYTAKMTPVRDQGDEGTCVAFASVVGLKEYQDTSEFKKLIELSPRFIYNLCKENDGAPSEEGTYPRVAMKMLVEYGVCPEAFWPYFPYQTDEPKKGAQKLAKKYQIKAYARLKGITEMKRSLVINGPFLAGVEVYKSWFNQDAEKTGLIPIPKPNEELMGGHAICIVGYDNAKKLFKFKNSWSAKWADCGYGYLPYAYLKKYCSDAWSATDLIENPKALVKKLEQIIAKFA
ncbi:MAG: C1 family peptidase [Candidatus Omnitrophota bacterium]